MEINTIISEPLFNIFKFCAENKHTFNIKNFGEKNDIQFIIEPEFEVNVTLVDYNDEKFGLILINKFEELQKFFK
jgi:ribosomal protein L23